MLLVMLGWCFGHSGDVFFWRRRRKSDKNHTMGVGKLFKILSNFWEKSALVWKNFRNFAAMKPSALRMQNEKRHIILLHKALQLLSQGAAIHSIFTSHYNTAVLQSGDSCLRFMTQLSQVHDTAVSGSWHGCLRFRWRLSQIQVTAVSDRIGLWGEARPCGLRRWQARRETPVGPQASQPIPAGIEIYPRRELNFRGRPLKM